MAPLAGGWSDQGPEEVPFAPPHTAAKLKWASFCSDLCQCDSHLRTLSFYQPPRWPPVVLISRYSCSCIVPFSLIRAEIGEQ